MFDSMSANLPLASSPAAPPPLAAERSIDAMSQTTPGDLRRRTGGTRFAPEPEGASFRNHVETRKLRPPILRRASDIAPP
jgi:hypothetical protein